MPGAMGTRYVAGCPPSRSPRNTSKIASAIAPPPFSGYKSIFRPQRIVSIRWAFRVPVTDAASMRFLRGRLHYFSFPRLGRGLDDQDGCELLGSLRAQARCG